jgi:hypothetical protein
VVIYSLSRKYEEEGFLSSLSFIVADWLQAIRHECFQDPKLSSLIQYFQQYSQVSSGYSWHNEEIFYKGLLYLSKPLNLKSTFLFELHDSPTTRNLGFTKTYEWVKHFFFQEGMKHYIHAFVVECDTINEIREKH